MSSCVTRSEYLSRIRAVRSVLAARSGLDPSAKRADTLLGRLEQRLARPARIMLLGEVNGGKTTLANRLLGTDLLTTDVVHNTRAPVLLRYAAAPTINIRKPDGTCEPLARGTALGTRICDRDALEVGLPFEALKDIEVIDTPGASATESVRWTPPRLWGPADVIVWCTVATQAWRASERDFWKRVGTHRRQAHMLAITHADLLDAADQKKVLNRVEGEVATLFSSILVVGHHTAAATSDSFRDTVTAAVSKIRSEQCQKASEIIARAMQPAKAAPPKTSDVARPVTIEPIASDLPSDWAPIGTAEAGGEAAFAA